MSVLTTVADLLDKLAEESERAPAPSPAAQVAETKVASDPVRDTTDKLSALVGKVSPETAAKVAADRELLEIVEKLSAERNKSVAMGGPAEDKIKTATSADDRKERLAATMDNWSSAISRYA